MGTFIGVYTPTILTILGVIMYLRFGWVVGQVGLPGTLLIVVLAHVVTMATSLSLSAIATNTRVGVGGAYYIISRSLGLEAGGAIGLPLFIAQALSVTLYAFGLAESLRIVFPQIPLAQTAAFIIIAVSMLAFRGAGAALKAQLPVMGLIGLSLASLALGALTGEKLTSSPSPVHGIQPGFWTVFAVFFPAVTGIMAGLSLSGDLRDPRRSIPRGTIGAALTGFAVYLLVPVLLSMAAEKDILVRDPLVWTRIALFGPFLVLPALWGAIFSSAVGSMLAAPRTLQALAMDRLMPRAFGRRSGRGGESLSGYFLTVAISLGAVLLGDLNTVAIVVTMFFLSVYGVINLVAALERILRNPSWRPMIRVHWLVGLTGAAGSFGIMFLIHWPSTLFAIGAELGVWLWLRRRIHNATWGDLRRDLYEALVRWVLIQLDRFPISPRNWRPHVLVFVGDTARRIDLVRFASWFNEERGVVTVCELVPGDLLEVDIDLAARQEEIKEILQREGIAAFGEVNVAWNIEWGILTVTQAHGMGSLESNTVLIGFPDELRRLTFFLRVVKHLKRINRSLVIGKIEPLPPHREGVPRVIHVWWGGLKRNSDLMLLLAYLLTCNAEWRNARIHVMSVASNELMKQQTEQTLARLIPEIRIEAEVEVMVRRGNENIHDIIRERSFGADVVFLGLGEPEEGKEEEYARRVQDLVDCMPTCFLVHNGSLFIGGLVTEDESVQPMEVEEEAATPDVGQGT
ncbi:MAG: Na-K-Cl cotransporter [Desulfobulbaceae bacterium]